MNATPRLSEDIQEFLTLQRLEVAALPGPSSGVSIIQTNDEHSLLNQFVTVEDPTTTYEELETALDMIPRQDALRTAAILSDQFSEEDRSRLAKRAASRVHHLTGLTRYWDSYLRSDQVCRALLTAGIDAPNSAEGLLFENDFIEPWATTQEGRRVPALKHLATGWATGEDARLCMLLAPAGFGKSKLTHILAKRLARQYESSLETDKISPLPYLIPFGQYRRTTSFGGLIMEAQARYGAPLLTAEAFQFLVAKGRALFILDGYDEMLEQRPETAKDNVADFVSNAGATSRILLTSRTLFYRSSGDVVGMVSDPNLTPNDVELVELEPFDKVQAKEFIRIKLEKSSDRSRKVERAQQLVDRDSAGSGIYGSPFFLSEFVSLVRSDKFSLTDVDEDGSLAFLVKVAFQRERERQAHSFSDGEQRKYLESLAFDMLRTGAVGYDLEELEVFVLEALEPGMELSTQDSSRKLSKLFSHHFLTTADDSDGQGFATLKHQVWRDFFQGSALAGAIMSRPQEASLVLNMRDMPEGVVRSAVSSLGGVNHPRLERLADSANDVGLRNILRFISASADRDAGAGRRVQIPNSVATKLRGRALIDLTLSHLDFRGMDLTSTNLSGAYLIDCDLTETRFDDALLSRTTLIECTVDKGLAGANNASISIDGAELFGPQLRLLLLPDGDEPAGPAHGDLESFEAYVVRIMTGRLSRFVKPIGFDASISWTNFMGGLPQNDRDFVVKHLVRALKAESILYEDSGRSGSRPPFLLTADGAVRKEILGLVSEDRIGPLLQEVVDRIGRRSAVRVEGRS